MARCKTPRREGLSLELGATQLPVVAHAGTSGLLTRPAISHAAIPGTASLTCTATALAGSGLFGLLVREQIPGGGERATALADAQPKQPPAETSSGVLMQTGTPPVPLEGDRFQGNSDSPVPEATATGSTRELRGEGFEGRNDGRAVALPSEGVLIPDVGQGAENPAKVNAENVPGTRAVAPGAQTSPAAEAGGAPTEAIGMEGGSSVPAESSTSAENAIAAVEIGRGVPGTHEAPGHREPETGAKDPPASGTETETAATTAKPPVEEGAMQAHGTAAGDGSEKPGSEPEAPGRAEPILPALQGSGAVLQPVRPESPRLVAPRPVPLSAPAKKIAAGKSTASSGSLLAHHAKGSALPNSAAAASDIPATVSPEPPVTASRTTFLPSAGANPAAMAPTISAKRGPALMEMGTARSTPRLVPHSVNEGKGAATDGKTSSPGESAGATPDTGMRQEARFRSAMTEPSAHSRRMGARADGDSGTKAQPDGVQKPVMAPLSISKDPSGAAIRASTQPAPGHTGLTTEAGMSSAPWPRVATSATFQRMDAAAEPRVMESTPHRLAVGVQSGGLGWVEIHASGAAGQVAATLATSSVESHSAIAAQLPSVREFLAGEHIHVASLTSERFSQTAGGHDGSSSQSGGSDGSQSARSMERERLSQSLSVEGDGESLSYVNVRV